jgi:hypothetical protein
MQDPRLQEQPLLLEPCGCALSLYLVVVPLELLLDSPVVTGVEWLLAWPGNGIVLVSSCFVSSFGFAWVAPLPFAPAAACGAGGVIDASEDGRALGGAATD